MGLWFIEVLESRKVRRLSQFTTSQHMPVIEYISFIQVAHVASVESGQTEVIMCFKSKLHALFIVSFNLFAK